MVQAQLMQILQPPLQRAQEWVRELTEITGRKDEEKAWEMMRGVLRVLRDRITVAQTAHLSAQLPMVIRGMYFENWRPADQPVKLRKQEEFVEAVAEELSMHPEIDPPQAIDGVFRMLNNRISHGELEKVRKMLPPEIRDLWPED